MNLNLTYDDERRMSAGIFYTAIGRTLLTGAAKGLDGATPNVFQEPVEILDATVSKGWAFNKRGAFTITVKAKNLLAPEALTIRRSGRNGRRRGSSVSRWGGRTNPQRNVR